MAAVIRSGWARGREVRWRSHLQWVATGRGGGEERGMAVDGGERRGENNYQPVR